MFRFLFKIILCILGLSLAIVGGVFYHYAKEIPDYSQLASYNPQVLTRIYAQNGKLIEEYSSEYRIFIPINSIPQSLINTFIAAEDKYFYSHSGIDLIGLSRALLSNITNLIQGKRLQGASTITQQVVKNFLLTPERSMTRKIKEAILAYKISQVLSKEQILELYLNQIYLGNGAYGVAAAAQVYFNKSLSALTIPEAAMLAALSKAPSSFSKSKNLARIRERRDYVINRMLEDGYISPETARRGIEEPITLAKRATADTIPANYYAEHVRQELIKTFGKDTFYQSGLTVVSCLDSKYQTIAERAFRNAVREYDRRRGYRGALGKIKLAHWMNELQNFPTPASLLEYKLAVVIELADKQATLGFQDGSTGHLPLHLANWAASNLNSLKKVLKLGEVIAVEPVKQHYALRQIPAPINGGMIVMNYETGQVLAMVGGYDFSASKFNRVAQAQRQPGSTIKPIVYLAALEQGIEPNTIFADQAIEIPQGKGMPIWKPKNIKGDFLGNITMRRGLELSRNLVTVRVGQAAGIKKIMELIRTLGISQHVSAHYSAVLGSLETTLENLTNAYAIIARGGTKITPQYIELIKDRNGKIIYKRNTQSCANCLQKAELLTAPLLISHKNERLIDEASSYQLISMLEGAVRRGTARAAAKLPHAIAGKTGTTNNNMDAWFIGFSAMPKIVVGTYLGYDNPASLGSSATGASVALPAFIEFMTEVLKDYPNLPFIAPNSIILDHIDPYSGLPSHGVGSIQEAFKRKQYKDVQKNLTIEYEEFPQVEDIFDKSLNENEPFLHIEAGEVY